ncbi:unnamed protein product, partial [Larinioides sclopetarius]
CSKFLGVSIFVISFWIFPLFKFSSPLFLSFDSPVSSGPPLKSFSFLLSRIFFLFPLSLSLSPCLSL